MGQDLKLANVSKISCSFSQTVHWPAHGRAVVIYLVLVPLHKYSCHLDASEASPLRHRHVGVVFVLAARAVVHRLLGQTHA